MLYFDCLLGVIHVAVGILCFTLVLFCSIKCPFWFLQSSRLGGGSLLLCFDCLLAVIHVGVGVLCLFHTVPLVGPQDAGGGGGGGYSDIFKGSGYFGGI